MDRAEASVTNYFSYVKNVLGVRALYSGKVREALQAPVSENEAQVYNKDGDLAKLKLAAADLVFLNLKTKEDQSVFSEVEAELLDKMIQAMRLGNRRVVILEATWDDKADEKSLAPIFQKILSQFKFINAVVFSTKPHQNGVFKILTPVKYLECFSPAYLVQNPAAKKVAWTDLQKMMREMGVT